jgi:hypothetical protein
VISGFSISGVTPGYERVDHWAMPDKRDVLQAKSIVLDNARIKLPPGSGEIIRIRRFHIEANLFVYLGLYRHAFETGRSRPGGYMSAGVWLLGSFLDGLILLPRLRHALRLIERTCCRDSEFVSRLERSQGIFRYELAAEFDNFRKSLIQLPVHITTAKLSSNSLFYDFSQLGCSAEAFLLDFLQLSIAHSAVGDMYLTTSKPVAEATQRGGSIPILNEFDLAMTELGYPISSPSRRLHSSAEEPTMAVGPTVLPSSKDSYALDRVMTRIGSIEQQVAKVANANRRNVAFIWMTIGALVAIMAGISLSRFFAANWW